MKLLVFGATGGTGHRLVELALARGHEVAAFARNPAKLVVEHANLEVVRGDVTDFASVARAARGLRSFRSSSGTPSRTTRVRRTS